jgi:Tfp pilus assembly ATPase PilU
MQTMNQALYNLYVKRQITYEECTGRSSDVDELTQMIQRGPGGSSGPPRRQ